MFRSVSRRSPSNSPRRARTKRLAAERLEDRRLLTNTDLGGIGPSESWLVDTEAYDASSLLVRFRDDAP